MSLKGLTHCKLSNSDLFQAEKKVTVVKAEQIHTTTIKYFTQNGQKLSFCEFARHSQHVFFQLEINHMSQQQKA